MKKFLGIGALALACAAMPTQQASAWVKCGFGINVNYSFEWSGIQWPCFSCCPQQCNYPCNSCYLPNQTIVQFPGMDHHGPSPGPHFPPPPAPGAPAPRNEEVAAQWGYAPGNYSYYHPVSYYPAQAQPNYYPASSYYYPSQYYYPANYGAPAYYPSTGMTFDR